MKFFLTLFFFFSFAQDPAELAQLNPMSIHLASGENVKPGGQGNLTLSVHLQEGFFAYGDKFKVRFKNIEEVENGDIFIDPLVDYDDSITKKKKRGVVGDAKIKTMVQYPKNFPNDLKKIKAQLQYVACTKKFCLTPRLVDFEIPTEIKEEISPVPASNNLTTDIQKHIKENFLYALLLIFGFGFLTSLTPCVYPLIPITLAVLGAKEGRSKWTSLLLSLSYVFGISLTYAGLGVVAAQTGQLFGSFISHPAVVITMSLLFVAMGLSLFGLFEMQLPASIRDRLQNFSANKSFAGAFVSGLLAGIVASPCVGPVLVGVLAYIAQTQDSLLGFIMLFVFAWGFGSLFVVLGTFSQGLQMLPKSGAWMNTVKYALGLAFFAMAVYYAMPLFKNLSPETPSAKVAKTNGVQWIAFQTDEVEKAKAAGRPVIIDFYADWCVACVEMEKFTFSVKEVIEKSKAFAMLKVDATEPEDWILEVQKKYEVYGLPTMIFINAKGEVMTDLTLTGFEKAEDFLERMDRTINP